MSAVRWACALLVAALACARPPESSAPAVIPDDLTSPAALTGLGDTYLLAGDYANARRVYARLLATSRSKQDSVQAILRIGEALTFAGDITAAQSALAPGILLARAYGDAALEYAVLYRINALQRWNGQLAAAEWTIREMEAVGTHVSLPQATRRENALRTLLVSALLHAQRGNDALALRAADEYVDQRTRDGLPPQREMTLGLVASYLGRHADAVDFLERAPETGSMPLLQYQLGIAHEALGDRAKSLEYFGRVSSWRTLEPVDRLQLPFVRDRSRNKLPRR